MTLQLTSEQVWEEIEKELFAVLGMVTVKQESRTVGIVYIVRERKLYIATGKDTWKARHIRNNPNVSITIPIAKRILVMPWMKIPAATITFSGKAQLIDVTDVTQDILRGIFRGMADDQEMMADSCIIEVIPENDFVTYGIGISLMQMRFPEKARGRAPVS
jgi:uncharacterized pyridoxamine 5'-phosphate oxidase family protein